MRAHKYIMESFRKSYSEKSTIYRDRIHAWRNEATITKLATPSNIARARTLGYKAKESYTIVRVRIGRGRRKRRTPRGGRKPAKNVMFLSPGTSLQFQAEIKAGHKYPEFEVLNSYWVGEDGNYKYFEVILVDTRLEPYINLQKGRVFRGLTYLGRKTRGIAKA